MPDGLSCSTRYNFASSFSVSFWEVCSRRAWEPGGLFLRQGLGGDVGLQHQAPLLQRQWREIATAPIRGEGMGDGLEQQVPREIMN